MSGPPHIQPGKNAERAAETVQTSSESKPSLMSRFVSACSRETSEKQPERRTDEISIGAQLDGPDDYIGHMFVCLKESGGQQKCRGFWPANGFDLGEKEDRKGVVMGMPGSVEDDSEYPGKSGSVMKSFSITPEKSKAAWAMVKKYEDEEPEYNLATKQCATFALDVLRTTGNDIDAGFLIPRPRTAHRNISKDLEEKKGDL